MTPHKKIVEWSEEDKAFIGSAPPIVGRCCHGDNEFAVFERLIDIVEDWEAIRGVEEWSNAVFKYFTSSSNYVGIVSPVNPGMSTLTLNLLTYHSCVCVTNDIGQLLYRDKGMVMSGRHRSVVIAPIGYQYFCSAFGSTS
jgi:hypothetical protein